MKSSIFYLYYLLLIQQGFGRDMYIIKKMHTSRNMISTLIFSRPKAIDEVDVRQFGAKGNGNYDDSQSIQQAINYAKNTGKSTVTFPSGRYLILKKGIIVRQGILLKGVDRVPAKSGFGSDLCQFEIKYGSGDTTKSAFLMESFSSMVGFSILYPDQLKTLQTPIKYGWTITTNGKPSQDGITLRNLMMTNSYLGIKLDNGGQHSLENIFGQPIQIGIYIDRQYDVLRINNVHFWPFYTQPGQSLYNWIEANGVGIMLNRTDGLQGTNWFVYGYFRGLHLKNSGYGSPWLTVNNILFDVCRQPIVIDAVNYLSLNNITLTGSDISVAQQGILINETVNDINSMLQFNGLITANFINSLVNKGVCTIISSMKSKNYNGQNNGVRWFDVINENDNSLMNITLPLSPGDDYRRIAGKMQINGQYNYIKSLDISPNQLNNLISWTGNIERASYFEKKIRLKLLGNTAVISYLLPPSICNDSGVYILEMKVNVYSETGALGTAIFYPRLRNYSNKVDYSLTPYIGDPYFSSPITLKIPFTVNSAYTNLDFVFGNATNTKNAYVDVSNLKIYKANGSQAGYLELMPKHQKLRQN